MNTKPLPITITLIAACISCVFSILQHASMAVFLKRFALSVLLFYILGSIIKVTIDKWIEISKDEPIEEEEILEEVLQDIKSEEEDVDLEDLDEEIPEGEE